MPRKINSTAAVAWLLSICFSLPGIPAFADPPPVDEVLGVLGLDKGQIAELAKGHPVSYALNEDSADELAVGIAWYLPVAADKVAGQLRLADPDLLDVGVTAHGLLTEHSGSDSLASVALSEEDAQALLIAGPGEEFNLSAHEIDKLKTFKQELKRTPYRAIEDAAGEYFRDILLQRYEAYRRGGVNAIAPYARKENRDSKPSLELRQAANASPILSRYLPDLHKVWLDYPHALPPGAREVFLWVEKPVEGRPAAILRHRINIDWNGGVLVLTREFYTPHSYNSSQWLTGCLPYLNGTVIFQQVRSFTDQVAGVASNVKHMVGRKLLKDKMLQSFERLGSQLGKEGVAKG